MKPRRTLSGYALLVGIMGLSIVGGVLAFQIFSAATKSQVTQEQSTLTKSLDGSIDQKVINNLRERTVYSDSQLNAAAPKPTSAVTPSPTPTPGGNILEVPTAQSASPSGVTQ